MCPTRELSRQNHTVLLALGDYLNISTCLVVSGENVTDMAHRLQHGVHVVVGKCATRTYQKYIYLCM